MRVKAAIGTLWMLAASALLFSEEGKFEKSFPPPHGGDEKLGFSRGGCSVLSVTVRNFPSREDIDKARSKDPNDKSWVWWDFHVENRGNVECKISLWVDIFDKNGKAVKSSDRSGSVNAGKMDDNIRMSARMRTLDIADSPKATVRAQIGPK
ncbi:MAG TPA: hypothetical protein VKG01_07895 [Thermoanaerobaculia bacterium]|nr:hypothetical protein [Thermoanaerobaculia bacterium]